MGRLTIGKESDVGGETAGFYGANTLGACAGAVIGPFLLVPLLGFRFGLIVAAGLDLLAAGIALSLVAPAVGESLAGSGRIPRRLLAILPVPFFMGAAALALEVILTRVLITVTGASVYAFAIVLAVFLAGIGVGSRLAPRVLRRVGSPSEALLWAAALVPALCLFGLLLLRTMLGEADLFGSLQNRMPAETGAFALWTSHAIFAALALFPPALAFGLALPAAVGVAAARSPETPRESILGIVYAANTAGALLGALGAAFVLMPAVGIRLGIAGAVVLSILAAISVPGVIGGRRWKILAGGGCAGIVLGLLVLSPARGGVHVRVIRSEVGRHANAVVEETQPAMGAPVRSLRINGKVVATTAPVDIRLQRLIAHIPGYLHGRVESALVIGLGTGMTAGALLDLPGIKSVEVFEISPAVVEAARAFDRWNGSLHRDPRVHLHIADGRHALARSSRKYDLITADPIHPWTRGSSDLYSIEHFRIMAEHLAPGGVASQWLPLYQLSELDVKTIVATWLAAFPVSSAWLTAYDLVLVGSLEPLPELSSAARLPAAMQKSLSPAGIHSAPELLALKVADTESLAELASGVEPMGDDRPVLEFRAPLSFLQGYCVPILNWSARDEFLSELPAGSRARGQEVRNTLRRFLKHLPEGFDRAIEAYGRELLSLPPLRARARITSQDRER